MNGGPQADSTSLHSSSLVSFVSHPLTVSGPFIPEGQTPAKDVKIPSLPSPGAGYPAPGAPPPHAAGELPATVVFNYVNPRTGERVVSLLPPDHPQMVCLQQGGHVTASKFGFLGKYPSSRGITPSMPSFALCMTGCCPNSCKTEYLLCGTLTPPAQVSSPLLSGSR